MQKKTPLAFLFSQRNLWAWAALSCVAAMAFALYMEHVKGLLPCNLCMLQRGPVIIIGIWSIVAFAHNPKGIGQMVYGIGAFVFAVIGALIAGRHIWLQNLPPDQVPACGPDFDFLMSSFPILETILIILEGSGDCAEVSWSFLGLTMPEQVLILFICFGMGGLVQSVRGWSLWRQSADKKMPE